MNMAGLHVLWLLLAAIVGYQVQGQCIQRSFGFDSFVCVCNATYCDEVGAVAVPGAGEYVVYTSAREALRLEPSTGLLDDASSNPEVTVTVVTSDLYQEMIGFGGSMTDSAGINLNTLSAEARENVLRAYFAPEGLEYNVMRTPIGGSDFSTRPYSLDDVDGDVDLEFWALAPEDINDKIPNIIRAMELSNTDVYLFGSPWSPPTWMKTIQTFNGTGAVLPEMWQPWANYLVMWAEAYEASGVPVWGLTPQNEPLTTQEDWGINACKWLPEDMRDWLKGNLGPSLETAGLRRLKMMVLDFNRDNWEYIIPLLEDPDCSQYIDGVALHWYSDNVDPDVLNQIHDLDPTKFLLYTEACVGIFEPNPTSVKLGDWDRGELYLTDIVEDINHWSTGWVDWNIALSPTGGPHWPGGAMDSPIIVNPDSDEFFKQPTFFAMAHVSKFIKRGGNRITANSTITEIKSAGVVNPDGSIVVVVVNTNETVVPVTISFEGSRFINTELPSKSFQTFIVPGEQ